MDSKAKLAWEAENTVKITVKVNRNQDPDLYNVLVAAQSKSNTARELMNHSVKVAKRMQHITGAARRAPAKIVSVSGLPQSPNSISQIAPATVIGQAGANISHTQAAKVIAATGGVSPKRGLIFKVK